MIHHVAVLKVAAIAMVAAFVTLGLYTFGTADGLSYLSSDPSECINCHVMRPEWERWNHSSHKAVADCNGCHTPPSFFARWVVKGINGWNHSFAFTTGRVPDPIRIRPLNARVAQNNCIACHSMTVSQIHVQPPAGSVFCVRCHGSVGHEP